MQTDIENTTNGYYTIHEDHHGWTVLHIDEYREDTDLNATGGRLDTLDDLKVFVDELKAAGLDPEVAAELHHEIAVQEVIELL